ncbi:DUF6177 family protein [Frondihabitans sp. 762G35]|uniref:DUF6177 family protein n=1 Tax=Frondihabitans sp. 762G35 TaxID=1446794 RepID=UPI000E706834|nr:DUF6177 family protein [Frondihabitans sp. 762G35]
MGTSIRHPLIDGITARVVRVETRASVIRLSGPLADVLARPPIGGRRVVIVSPEGSRITIGLRAALTAAGGAWLVRTAAGYRDGVTGILRDHVDDFDAADPSAVIGWDEAGEADEAAGDRVAPSGSDPVDRATQLSVDVTVLHRASHETLLGGALEALCEAVGGYRPRAWGRSEPLDHAWDRWVLTQDARHRAPDTSRVIVEGRHLSAAVTARVTDRGIEETVALTADVPGGSAGVDAAVDRVRVALGDLAREALPTFALVLAREGETDRTFRAVSYPPPNPLVLLIGAPSVRRLDLAAAAFGEAQRVDVVGRPAGPAFLLPLGDAAHPGWDALHDALDSVGSERLTTLLSPPLLQAWEDDLHADLEELDRKLGEGVQDAP